MGALASAVREDRLWQRHADMAKLGGTPKGGVNRQALSAEDAAARNQLAAWAAVRGFSISTDAIGNLFVRREGSDPAAAPVMSGSHMDSQPTGGRFDGMYGVLAAGIQGSRRYIVETDGEEAHAGTTPRAARKDAFAAATRIAAAMYEATTDADDTLRFTIGRAEVHPGSPNTVPGKASFTIDMRHPQDAVLEAHEKKLHDIVASRAAPCSARIERVVAVAPTDFDPRVIDLVCAKAGSLGLSHMDMPSGAGHDAMHIARLCPAGMIFVPSERGISHNEIENATPADLAAGTRVLVEVLAELANR